MTEHMSRGATQLLRLYGVTPRANWVDYDAGTSGISTITVEEATILVADTARTKRCPITERLPDHVTSPASSALAQAKVRLLEHQYHAVNCLFESSTPMRVRSGVIKAPCGAGKTYIGIGVAARLGEPTLVVAPTHEANTEWRRRLEDLGVSVHVCGATQKAVAVRAQPSVVVMTYAMLSRATRAPLKDLSYELVVAGNVWRYGLVIYDEVWTLPAEGYLHGCALMPCNVRLGLTADERRCDGRQNVIESFVGPILHDTSLETALATHMVAPIVREVVVVATSTAFRSLYSRASTEQRRVLSILNPQKMHRFVSILRTTVRRKVLVYCDKLSAMRYVQDLIAKVSSIPFRGVLSGSVSMIERTRVCSVMRDSPNGIALFSKVGNASIDLPDVDLVIELSTVDTSAQQKTQRDGRAQRAHESKTSALVITLVSKGTREQYFVDKKIESVRGGVSAIWSESEYEEPIDCPWDDAALEAFVSNRKRSRDDGASTSRHQPCM